MGKLPPTSLASMKRRLGAFSPRRDSARRIRLRSKVRCGYLIAEQSEFPANIFIADDDSFVEREVLETLHPKIVAARQQVRKFEFAVIDGQRQHRSSHDRDNALADRLSIVFFQHASVNSRK